MITRENRIDSIVREMARLGLPMEAFNHQFLTEDERTVFFRCCRLEGVKHSDELNAASVAPMTSADLARANID